MTNTEKIIVSMLVHSASLGTLDWHSILYMILEDLDIQNLGTIRADLSRILRSQQLYKEYCLGCNTFTGMLSLEIISHCPSCSPSQRSAGLHTQYILHFLFGLETEGPARRALYQTLYRSGIISSEEKVSGL